MFQFKRDCDQIMSQLTPHMSSISSQQMSSFLSCQLFSAYFNFPKPPLSGTGAKFSAVLSVLFTFNDKKLFGIRRALLVGGDMHVSTSFLNISNDKGFQVFLCLDS